MSTIRAEKTMELVVGDEAIHLGIQPSAIEVADWEVEDEINIEEAVQQAFDHPIDFPALREAIVEGDRIALAVEPGLPQMTEIVEGVIRYLLSHNAKTELITVLLAQEHEAFAIPLASRLSELASAPIDVRYHHGQDPDSMGYLAAAKGAEPIYVDRALLEADVVLPITCARDPNAWAYAGLYGIVPWFTDVKTQKRWRHDYATERRGNNQQRLRAAKEVAWLLGIQPVLAVVPGPNGRVDSVFFGNANAVEQTIASAVAPRSIGPSAEAFDLVVCSIDGDRDQQTWDNIAQGPLYMAEHFLRSTGVVAVITRLSEKPGSIFRRLASVDDLEKTERFLLHSEHPQALAAIEIFRSLTKRSVYMMSQLASEQIEEIGIGLIADVQELEHLISSHDKILVISGAQHRRVRSRIY